MGRGALSISKFCNWASVGRTIVFDEIKSGRLIAHKRGRSTIIFVEDADAWLEALPRVRPSAPDAVIPPSPPQAEFGTTPKSSVRKADGSRRAPQRTSLPRGPPQTIGDVEVCATGNPPQTQPIAKKRNR